MYFIIAFCKFFARYISNTTEIILHSKDHWILKLSCMDPCSVEEINWFLFMLKLAFILSFSCYMY